MIEHVWRKIGMKPVRNHQTRDTCRCWRSNMRISLGPFSIFEQQGAPERFASAVLVVLSCVDTHAPGSGSWDSWGSWNSWGSWARNIFQGLAPKQHVDHSIFLCQSRQSHLNLWLPAAGPAVRRSMKKKFKMLERSKLKIGWKENRLHMALSNRSIFTQIISTKEVW